MDDMNRETPPATPPSAGSEPDGKRPAENRSAENSPLEKRSAEKRPARKNSTNWISIVLAVLLLGSIIFNVVTLILLCACSSFTGGISADRENANYNEIQVMGDDKSKNKIFELSLIGTLMDNDDGRSRESIVTRVRSELMAARRDESIKGLLLVINSPGGGITASDYLWKEIKNYKEEKKVPVVAYCKDLAASGGYYVASASDYIMANETSLVGNIGVIAEFMNLTGLCGKIGLEMNIIKSNTFDGKESVKDMGSPFRAMKPSERKYFQSMINQMWNRFVDVVAEGRKKSLTRDQVARLADGAIFTGRDAKEKKLVDALGYKEDAFEHVKEMAKLKDARLVRYKSRFNVFQEILSSHYGGQNVQLLPDYRELMDGRTPRLMYLWTAE